MIERKRSLRPGRALLLLAALAAAFLAAAFFSESTFAVAPFEFTAALVPLQRGDTVIAFPPLGQLRAATHRPPFQLKITLNTVDPERLKATLQENPDLAAYLTGQLRQQLLHFFARLTLISFLCGAALLLLLEARSRRAWRLKIREALKGGLLAMLLLAVLLGTTIARPYRLSAFAAPQLEGALAEAPWLIELGGQLTDTIARLSQQFGTIAGNLEELSGRMGQFQPAPESGEIRVLHISDIHNNPAALELIERIADAFQVDLIIDTGDLIDYGSTLEAELAARLAALPYPYLFLPGNHDTAQSIALLRREGARIIGPEPLEIGGLRIAGLPDPGSSGSAATVREEQLLLKEAGRAAAALPERTERADLFALHNPLMAAPFRGELPLILCGHTHRAALDFDEASGTVMINAGSTGAAGVRGLLSPRDNPYSMVVLHFSTASGRPRLSCADLITIDHFPESFTLQRHYNPLPEELPGETLSPKEDPAG